MGLLVMLLFACLLLPLTKQKPSYLITAPNVVHVGMDETITVQVSGADTGVAVTVYFENQTGKASDIISPKKYTVELNQMNNFTEIILAQVLPQKTNHLNFAREAQYVMLVAEISAPFERTRKALIRLLSRPYFIYIVTDKPIYTPDETVRYRIFTLDQEMKPIDCTIMVEVLDSEGTVLASMNEQTDANSVHSGEINIQSEMTGNYQIRAKVSEHSEYHGSITFRVHNYELPKFDVRIIPDYWYYLVASDSFSFTIEVHDKSEDDLFSNVTFGMRTTSGHKIPLPKLQQGHRIQNDRSRVTLNSTALLESMKQQGGLDKFREGTLYITAEVTDKSRHTERKTLDNISFRISPYDVSLSIIKPYFIPGAEFYFLTSVTNPDGSPAPDVTLQVSINISGETTTTDDNVGLTDKIGEQSFVIHVPPHTQHINITAIAGTDDRTKSKTFAAVRKHKSPSKRYLHINVPHVFLYPGDIINVTLTAISQLDIHDLHHFYYMVLGKGKVLDFRTVERVEETTVQLPITQDMVPYFRIVAYYILDANGTEEIIADSLRVEVESPCDTKFQVDSALYKKHGRSYQLSLSVLSNSAAEVYVQTVDISLKEQHKQDTITMRKVLEALDSYDIGSSYGRSGTDAVSVFKDSGLHFFSNLLPELPGPAFNVSSMRRLRTVPGNKTSSSISDNHPPSSWKIQALNTSVKDDRGHLISPTFNGSSMWKLNTVPGNKISRLISDIHLPQSWEIQVLSMSAEDGLCLAKHKEVRLDGNDFQPRISSTALAREGEAHLHGDD